MYKSHPIVGRWGASLAIIASMFMIAGVSAPLAAQARPAMVSASITASPTAGVPGQHIAITAAGFNSGETIALFWDNQQLSGTDQASSTGSLSGAFAVVPMSTTSGTHTLMLKGSTSGLSASVTITVPEPALHGVPLNGAPGQLFPVRGTGFGANEMITFTWDGAALPTWHATATAEGNFGFGGAFGHIPSSATVGQHILLARGQQTGRFAQVTVMVQAKPAAATVSITASPTVAVPGQRIAITAAGFNSGETIALFWDNQQLSGTDQASNTGSLSGAFATVPMSTTTGVHTLMLKGSTSGLSANATITVPAPALHGVPLSGAPGQLFPVRGTGFGANEMITFTWDGVVLPTWHATATAEGNFGFGGAFGHIPSSAAVGQHVLVARGQQTGRSAQVTVMVSVTSLQGVPLNLVPGELFPVRGIGFGPKEMITFTWDGTVLPTWHATTTSQGSFGFGGAFGHVPYSATVGQHVLVARGQTSGRSAQVTVMVPAAALHGVPLSVTAGERIPLRGTGFGANEKITFTWDGAALPSWHATTTAQGNFGFGGAFGHIPHKGANPGQHVLMAHGEMSGRSAQVRVTVTAR